MWIWTKSLFFPLSLKIGSLKVPSTPTQPTLIIFVGRTPPVIALTFAISCGLIIFKYDLRYLSTWLHFWSSSSLVIFFRHFANIISILFLWSLLLLPSFFLIFISLREIICVWYFWILEWLRNIFLVLWRTDFFSASITLCPRILNRREKFISVIFFRIGFTVFISFSQIIRKNSTSRIRIDSICSLQAL